MTQKITDTISELRQAAIIAKLNYEIWWVYKSSDTRPVYVDTMNKYSPFFQTAIHAHFVAMITALYRIFETRKDTHNFKNLLTDIESNFSTGAGEIQQLKEKLESLKPTWIKISKLRNRGFGHRNSDATIEEIFEEVTITPDEFLEFIERTEELLNQISGEYLGEVHAFNTSAHEPTLNLLKDLKGAKSYA